MGLRLREFGMQSSKGVRSRSHHRSSGVYMGEQRSLKGAGRGTGLPQPGPGALATTCSFSTSLVIQA